MEYRVLESDAPHEQIAAPIILRSQWLVFVHQLPHLNIQLFGDEFVFVVETVVGIVGVPVIFRLVVEFDALVLLARCIWTQRIDPTSWTIYFRHF